MSRSQIEPLSQQEARELHRRLLDGDAVAPPDLAAAYLDPLADWLTGLNPRADPHVCTTAAEDAILSLIKNPASYKPERQTLGTYLRLSARGDFLNALRSESRHGKRRADWDAAELSPDARTYLWDTESDPALIVERREDELDEPDEPAVPVVPDSVRAGLTAQEERVLELMNGKERKTALFAAALGITHLAPDDQRREVKRVKDRLTKRVERAGDHHD